MKKILLFLVAFVSVSCQEDKFRLDISGEWHVCLDSAEIYSPGIIPESAMNKIMLPGTTDDAMLGTPNCLAPVLDKPQLLHLTRKHSYIGPAYYTRTITIPEEWDGRKIVLHLERIMWESQAWVDDTRVDGFQGSLVSPHEYDLTSYVRPGKAHRLTIKVDNRKKHDISVKELAHAYTEDTQVKWNGILGEMYLTGVPKTRISSLDVYPDALNRSARIKIAVEGEGDGCKIPLSVRVTGKNDEVAYASLDTLLHFPTANSALEISLCLGKDAPLWNEFNPYLYELTVESEINGQTSIAETDFGLRNMSHDGPVMMLNGKPLFLRGTLECCIFPLTGTPPMDKDGWKQVFSAAKAYGLNHLRFHSWCPPEAAFEVADEMGFYLQVELPVWALTVGQNESTAAFLKEEAHRIIREYGNHPSFCLWSMGNELEGDFGYLTGLLRELKSMDSRHLYTTTSFTFQQGHGVWAEPDDDFFVTQWTNNGWVRGQGVFNQYPPSFDKDYRTAITGLQVPLITHEIGQYSVYPDMKEIEKYTGTLLPLNFMAVRDDLEEKGLLHKAEDYLKASGELAAILYKEEIERALKTPGISGFQLLDLHDFPGQGTALVGLLNAFWESKGIISGEEFRRFCAPIVPLLRFPKAVYENNEIFSGIVELSNYSDENLDGKKIRWTISSDDSELASGEIQLSGMQVGHNSDLSAITCDLSAIAEASQLDVELFVEGTSYANSWKIWVYPTEHEIEYGDVRYTRSYDEALALLSKGGKVLFNPDWKTMKGIEGKFVPVFWSPVHFPNQAGTMGVLCDPHHPALADFPTGMHSDWQWWDLNINSTTLVVDQLQGGAPIVEMVDNFLKNRRLAALYEGKVGNGQLVIATFDLESSLDERPVARQMLSSVLGYMNSEHFNPSPMSGFEYMEEVFGTAKNEKQDAAGIY